MSDFYKKPGQIGELRDRNKEISDELVALEFERVDRYADVLVAVRVMMEELNVYRQNFGLDVLPITDGVVRFIGKEAYDANTYAKSASEGGAFFHPLNRNIFIRFDKKEYEGSNLERMRIVYIVAHELGHHAMEKNGLSRVLKNEPETLNRLTEGLVDWLAKKKLNQHIWPQVVQEGDLNVRARYIQDEQSEEAGVRITSEEVIPTSSEEDTLTLSYIPEIRLVEYLESTKPELFHALLKLAFEGKKEIASALLEQTLGSEIKNMIADWSIPTHEIITKMLNLK